MKPPDKKSAASDGDRGGRGNTDSTGSVGRVVPRIKESRRTANPSQPAPVWKESKGAAALRQLEALFGPPRTPIIRRRGRS